MSRLMSQADFQWSENSNSEPVGSSLPEVPILVLYAARTICIKSYFSLSALSTVGQAIADAKEHLAGEQVPIEDIHLDAQAVRVYAPRKESRDIKQEDTMRELSNGEEIIILLPANSSNSKAVDDIWLSRLGEDPCNVDMYALANRVRQNARHEFEPELSPTLTSFQRHMDDADKERKTAVEAREATDRKKIEADNERSAAVKVREAADRKQIEADNERSAAVKAREAAEKAKLQADMDRDAAIEKAEADRHAFEVELKTQKAEVKAQKDEIQSLKKEMQWMKGEAGLTAEVMSFDNTQRLNLIMARNLYFRAQIALALHLNLTSDKHDAQEQFRLVFVRKNISDSDRIEALRKRLEESSLPSEHIPRVQTLLNSGDALALLVNPDIQIRRKDGDVAHAALPLGRNAKCISVVPEEKAGLTAMLNSLRPL